MLKIYPEVIFKAINNNKPAGAFRVWFIAKDYDQGGSGFIPGKAFRYYLKSLGIPRGTYTRWITQAVDLGLIRVTRTVQGGQVYALVSWGEGAVTAGVTRLLKPVRVPLERFVKRGWLAWVWAGYIKHYEGKPISRATLEKLTGVPARTQYGYEKQAGVKSKAHFANFGDPSKDPDNAPGIDGSRGYYGKAGMTRKRLPDSRTVEGVQEGGKGRSDKANQKIAALLNVWGSSQNRYERLYCESYNQLKRANRAKNSDAKTRPGHRFLFITDALGVGIWEAVPC